MSSAGRRRDERGAVLVEASFVLPVVVLLFFAVIEFGLYFASSASATSTTREGARYASANFATSADKDVAADEIRDEVLNAASTLTGLATPERLLIFQASTDDEPIGGYPTCTTACFEYTWNGSTFVQTGGNGWDTPDACTADADGTVDRIGIDLRVSHGLITGLFGSEAVVEHSTVLRIEPLPLAQC